MKFSYNSIFSSVFTVSCNLFIYLCFLKTEALLAQCVVTKHVGLEGSNQHLTGCVVIDPEEIVKVPSVMSLRADFQN